MAVLRGDKIISAYIIHTRGGVKYIATPDGVNAVEGVVDIGKGMISPVDGFGDARAADVLTGKLFSSDSEGFKVQGTAVLPDKICTPSGGIVAAEINTDKNALYPVGGFGDASIHGVLSGLTFTSDSGIKQAGVYVPPTVSSILNPNTAKTTIGGVYYEPTKYVGAFSKFRFLLTENSIYGTGSMYYITVAGTDTVGIASAVKGGYNVVIFTGNSGFQLNQSTSYGFDAFPYPQH